MTTLDIRGYCQRLLTLTDAELAQEVADTSDATARREVGALDAHHAARAEQDARRRRAGIREA